MNCRECEHCKQIGRQQSQCGTLGRKIYYCENPKVYNLRNINGYPICNFIGYGDMTLESPLQLKTSKRWCPLKGEE